MTHFNKCSSSSFFSSCHPPLKCCVCSEVYVAFFSAALTLFYNVGLAYLSQFLSYQGTTWFSVVTYRFNKWSTGTLLKSIFEMYFFIFLIANSFSYLVMRNKRQVKLFSFVEVRYACVYFPFFLIANPIMIRCFYLCSPAEKNCNISHRRRFSKVIFLRLFSSNLQNVLWCLI